MKPFHATIALLAMCLLASGCAKKLQPDNLPALSGYITGSVAYRERIALPPDAKIVVSLEDVSRSDKSAAFVAQQTLRPSAQVPVLFNLRYIPSAINRKHSYAVRAAILDSEDELMWTSTASYPVLFNEPEKPLAIVMERVIHPDPVATPPVHTSIGYKCDEIEFIAKFEANIVQILLPARTLTLPRVISGSGARYTDGVTTFWSKGDTALFEMNGVSYKGCKADPLPTLSK